MKRLTVLICFSLILVSGCSHKPQTDPSEEIKKPLFTAYNIWKHESTKYMYAINFKSAPVFIPAGTPVYDAKIINKDMAHNTSLRKKIQFKLVSTDEKIKISFRHRWHDDKDIEDYFNMMFTTNNFEELVKGFSPDVIDAIKKGIVIEGMSKDAVIVSYGYPPEHKTPSLENNEWFYWMTTVRKKKICFDKEEKTRPCKNPEAL